MKQSIFICKLMILCNVFPCVGTSHQSHGQLCVIKCSTSPALLHDLDSWWENISHIYRKYDNKIEKQSVCWSSEREFLFCLLTVIPFFFDKRFGFFLWFCDFGVFFFLLLWSIHNLYRKYWGFIQGKKEDSNLFLKSHCSKVKAYILRWQNKGNVYKRSIYCWGGHFTQFLTPVSSIDLHHKFSLWRRVFNSPVVT